MSSELVRTLREGLPAGQLKATLVVRFGLEPGAAATLAAEPQRSADSIEQFSRQVADFLAAS